jgi:hypothetical protein
MKLSDLFKRDNVPFPDWLHDDLLNDEWRNSKYFKGDNIHKWELTILLEFNCISFDGEEYTFQGYDENNNLIFEKVVTPEYERIT